MGYIRTISQRDLWTKREVDDLELLGGRGGRRLGSKVRIVGSGEPSGP